MAMQKKRLLKLAALLEADAKNKRGIKFDLYIVAAPSRENSDKKDFKPQVTCGTTACAMGLAAVSGAFKRKEAGGLSFIIGNGSNVVGEMDIHTTVMGKKMSYDNAAEKIFHISRVAARYLFAPRSYLGRPTKGAEGELYVAQRIRSFVEGFVDPTNWPGDSSVSVR